MANKVSFIIQLKNRFSKTAEAFDRQFKKIEQSAARANARMREFKKRGENIRKLGEGFAKAGAVMSAAITLPVALLSRNMIAAASDATETANKFNSVFDDVRGKANQVANDFSKNFGTAGSTARKLIGDTGDLLVGFGFSGDAALELSRKVNELAADLTSFQNIQGGVPAASEALTKALLGETESAKSLGIVIRQNDKNFRTQVKTLMRAKRITEQQAKAIVILGQATQQSRKAVGDVARTWEDYASVVRRNDEATKELSESFGRLLIPIATKLTNVVTRAVKWVGSLSPSMKKLVLVTAGLAAVAGPLLLVLGGTAAAFAAISLPVLAVGAAVVGLGAVITAAALNWGSVTASLSTAWLNFSSAVGNAVDQVKTNIAVIWEGMKPGLLDFVNFGIKMLNKLLTPLNFVAEKLGFEGVRIPSIELPDTRGLAAPGQAPSAPAQAFSGSLNGQIVVSATPGAQVRETSLATKASGLRVGMNMAVE